MARSQLAIGEVTQSIDGFGDGLRMEEAVNLRLRTPWPLPQAPELTIKLTSALDASDVSAGAGELSSSLLDVGVQLAGTAAPPLPTSSLLDTITSTLASPPLAPLREFQTKASSTAVTAASETVRVDRSGLGEVRVFLRVSSGGLDPRELTDNGDEGDELVLDPQAQREIARVKLEAEERSKEALAEVTAATTSETAKLRSMLELAAAESASLAEERAVVEASLAEAMVRATDAADAAEAKRVEALQIAEAKAATAKAVAAAELADAMARGEELVGATKTAAAVDKERLLAAHAEELRQMERRAAAEVAAAEKELFLAMAKAEEEAAKAKAAHLAEKQELRRQLADAEDRAAKAKAAAIAAIGDL